jgi:hypothetical protein
MNRNDLSDIFEQLGGRAGFIRWSKKSAKNLAQAYSMLGRSVLHGDGDNVAPHAPPDPQEYLGRIEAALNGVIVARKRGDWDNATRTFVGGSGGVMDAGAAHESKPTPDSVPNANTQLTAYSGDITDTRHVANQPGIMSEEVAAPQRERESKPDDATRSTDTNVSVGKHVAAAKKPTHRGEKIVGLCACDALNGQSSQPDYGVNWSQTRAWY